MPVPSGCCLIAPTIWIGPERFEQMVSVSDTGELAAAGLDGDTINEVIEPIVRQRIPELAAAQDDLADKRFAATISHHTAGAVRRGLAAGIPLDERVLAKLDPAKIQKPQGFR
jgi:hypothetical protein